jgi:hypothetical protein
MSESCECSPDAGDNLHRAPAAVACPVNQQVGQRIDTLTFKALLALPLTELKSAAYRFCGAPDCPVVYYSGDGTQLFGEDQLRETVYQKHPGDDEAPVCYCFGHTRGSIRAELVLTGESTVVEQIEAGIRAGQCACDIRNPQGNCCLGNVRALVAQIKVTSVTR